MTVDFGGAANFNIAGTPYMTIDTAGRVLRPYQVSFAAYNGNGPGQGGDIIFQTAIFNIGNAYNAGNGRFTAPVGGRYYFSYHQLPPNANGGEFRSSLFVNGNGWGGGRFILNKPLSTWDSMFADGHLLLAAGDYVTVRFELGAGLLYTDQNYNQFSGHLIG